MKTKGAFTLMTTLIGWSIGLWCLTPGHAFPVAPPQETLAGLKPGVTTVADVGRQFGVYDVLLPGEYAQYAGGPRATNAYFWTTGLRGRLPGLIVETMMGSDRIDVVVVAEYPGLATSKGLMVLDPEQRAIEMYGMPNVVYNLTFGGVYSTPIRYRELFYVNEGLLIVLGQVEGRPNWTVTKMVLTYPTYLRNAIALRTLYALDGEIVEDITSRYSTWIAMAY